MIEDKKKIEFSVNKRSEVVRCKSPISNTINRLSYYTEVKFSFVNGKSVNIPFKFDTGACYTIIGLNNESILPFVKYIEENMLDEKEPVKDATNSSIHVSSLEVYDFCLTKDIIIPKLTIYFSKELGEKCILGLDILSLFEFNYEWERHQTIGTFWVRNYEYALRRINEYFENTGNTSPRTILLLDEVSVIDENCVDGDEYDYMSREELLTENKRLKSINSGLMATNTAIKDSMQLK